MSSIDLNGLSSVYGDMVTQAAKDATVDKFKETTNKDYTNATDEELMDACKQFEAYFLEQVFKEMIKTLPVSEDKDRSTTNLVDFFKDNTVTELAKQSTETNSLGLAQQLYEQMKRNYTI